MVKIDYSLSLNGLEFSPDVVIVPKNLKIGIIRKRGDIGQTGRYKNSPFPMGCLLISGELADLLDFVETLNLADLNVDLDDIVVNATVAYKGQCNFEFFPNELLRLSNINAHLTISCYEDNSIDFD